MRDRMKLNLQFFADEDVSAGVEESNVADSMEVEEGIDEGATETETVEEEKPEVDVNAIAAAARRKAEAEAKEVQRSIDAEYVRRFGNLKNPITGAPIRGQKDYLDALDAQEKLRRESELKEKGIDPALIENLVNNNPIVLEAQKYMADAREREVMNEINASVSEITAINPDIKTLDDVPQDVLQMAVEKGYSLPDAYKILNFGKMTSQKADAIRQGAINQAKSKAHLAPMNGVVTTDNSIEIPKELRGIWETAFPDKSEAELKKLYNKTLN